MGATENILKIRQLSSKNIISYKKHLLNQLEFPQELMGIHRMAGLQFITNKNKRKKRIESRGLKIIGFTKKGDITHTKVTIRFPGMANMKLKKMYKIDS